MEKLFQALQQGNTEGAKIYASNAIRKKTESLNLLRLSSRIDAVASRVETAVTMRQVTGSMGQVVRGMDRAMESMNLEMVSLKSRFITHGICERVMTIDTDVAPPSSYSDLRRDG